MEPASPSRAAAGMESWSRAPPDDLLPSSSTLDTHPRHDDPPPLPAASSSTSSAKTVASSSAGAAAPAPGRTGLSIRERLERKTGAADAIVQHTGSMDDGSAMVVSSMSATLDGAFRSLEKLSVETASSKKQAEDLLREIDVSAAEVPEHAPEEDITLLIHLLKTAYHQVGRDRLVDIISDTIEAEEMATVSKSLIQPAIAIQDGPPPRSTGPTGGVGAASLPVPEIE